MDYEELDEIYENEPPFPPRNGDRYKFLDNDGIYRWYEYNSEERGWFEI